MSTAASVCKLGVWMRLRRVPLGANVSRTFGSARQELTPQFAWHKVSIKYGLYSPTCLATLQHPNVASRLQRIGELGLGVKQCGSSVNVSSSASCIVTLLRQAMAGRAACCCSNEGSSSISIVLQGGCKSSAWLVTARADQQSQTLPRGWVLVVS
jgi:hypothetical protein